MYRSRPAGAVVPFLPSGEDLWLLLLSANALEHFTFYVPVADRGDSINAPLFRTLIIRCKRPISDIVLFSPPPYMHHFSNILRFYGG